jgi:hypothetical protein
VAPIRSQESTLLAQEKTPSSRASGTRGLVSQTTRSQTRPARNEADLLYWLENMVTDHHYSTDEAAIVLGLSPDQTREAMLGLGKDSARGARGQAHAGPLRVRPYPGGRHPRVGFLEGAIDPSRETKVSVFTPWDPSAYAVIDLPEAIWCDQELIYLAHAHIPTRWDKQSLTLPRLEWNRRDDGTLDVARKLPDGVAFGARVVPKHDRVDMELWLYNGSTRRLTDLRVQVCVMLKGIPEMSDPKTQNSRLDSPIAAARSPDGSKWLLIAFENAHRTWANPPVPCVHADPKFPDCPPGESQRIRGAFWFATATTWPAEQKRLQSFGLSLEPAQNQANPPGSKPLPPGL